MSIYPERLNYYVDGGAVSRPQFSAVATLISLVNDGVVPPIVNDLVWLSFALALHASEGGHTCIDLNEIDRWYPENAEPGALNWPNANEWLQEIDQIVLRCWICTERVVFCSVLCVYDIPPPFWRGLRADWRRGTAITILWARH